MCIYFVILLVFLEDAVHVYNTIWFLSPHIPPWSSSLSLSTDPPPSKSLFHIPVFLFVLQPTEFVGAPLCDHGFTTTHQSESGYIQLPTRVGLDPSAGGQMHKRPPFSQHQFVNSSSAEGGAASELHPWLAEERCSLVDLTRGNTQTVSDGWVTVKKTTSLHCPFPYLLATPLFLQLGSLTLRGHDTNVFLGLSPHHQLVSAPWAVMNFCIHCGSIAKKSFSG